MAVPRCRQERLDDRALLMGARLAASGSLAPISATPTASAISAMPGFLTTIAKLLPLTHALALMRYTFVDPSGNGLHDIWGMSNVTVEAWLSLAVVALFAAALTAISIRMFSRSAVS